MIFIAIVVGYATLMVVLGAIASRRVRAAADFFVAGRSLSTGLIFSTFLAANIGVYTAALGPSRWRGGRCA